MKLKNVFLSVAMFIFVFAIGGIFKAEAAAISASATGNWSAAGTWTPAQVPVAGDVVTIPSGFVVTVDAPAAAASVTINNAGAATGITISGTNTLTLTGALTLSAPTVAGTTTVAVGTGTLSAGSLSIGGGAAGLVSVVTVSTGTLDINGNVTFTGTAAQAQLTATGAATINVAGNFGNGASMGGTVTPSTSTLTLDGGAAQVLSTGTTSYNNVIIANTAGGVSTGGQVTIGGTLRINSGNFDPGAQDLTVTGTTTVASGGTMTISAVNENKVFTGDVAINSGGTWTESAAAPISFAGGLTVGGTMTASTGVHTFTGVTDAGVNSFSGSFTIPAITVTGGTYTNLNTLTVTTLTVTNPGTVVNTGIINVTTLTGNGDFDNGTAGILNIADTNTVTNFDARAETGAGNTVNYTKAGAQTVKNGTNSAYVNLGLSGSGDKTITAGTAISGNLIISGTAKANLSDTTNTANKLYFETTLKRSGTWGNTGSDATHIDAIYLAGTGRITVATGSTGSSVISAPVVQVTPGSESSTSGSSSTSTPVVTTTTEEVAPGCSGGNLFNTSTGKPCSNNTTVTSKKIYALGQTTLKVGSRGAAVTELQTALGVTPVTGYFGPITKAKVIEWQKSHGLKGDGIVGAKTKAKINE